MSNDTSKKHPATEPCRCCGGSGQLGQFHGESRFVISWDECEECLGTGYIFSNTSDRETPSDANKTVPPPS